jgi:hypothetical protein
MVDWNPKKFRRWLVRKLAETRWGGWNHDMSIEDLAKYLGVQPDVLLDAHKYSLSLASRGEVIAGLEPIKIRRGGQRGTLGSQLTVLLVMPKEIKEAWDSYRDLGGWTDSVLMRSLIHYGLTRSDQPKWLGRGWPYRGHTYRCNGWGKTENDWPWRIITRISPGAKAALIRRSMASRITLRGFIRGLVLDLLEGRIQSFDAITETSQMFQGDRYHTLEGVLESRAIKQQKESMS